MCKYKSKYKYIEYKNKYKSFEKSKKTKKEKKQFNLVLLQFISIKFCYVFLYENTIDNGLDIFSVFSKKTLE